MKSFLLVLSFACCSFVTARAAESSSEEAYRWLMSVDAQFKEPRLAGLTVEGVPSLAEVKLGGHRKSDGKHIEIPAVDFRHLTALPALRKAVLWEITGLTDEALAHIGKVTTLQELELGDAEVTNAGLKHLRGLSALSYLGLGWTKDVGDEGMPDVAQFTQLQTLILSGTKVTDKGLDPLTRLPKLRELRLAGLSGVSDAGLMKIKDCNALKLVIVNKKTGVTPEGIRAFRQARPDCEVVVK